MNKKVLGVALGSALIAIIAWTSILMTFTNILTFYGSVGVDMELSSIHCRIRVWDDDTLILDEYHSGAVTDLGDNMTMYKIFGDTDWQYGSLSQNANASWISIGNQGTLTTSSTQLPGEWNRTTLTVEDEIQSQGNMTCTFYPDSGGPYTADCIGINIASSGDGNLIMYDTFTEVTGIDETFTINIEFQVSTSHT